MTADLLRENARLKALLDRAYSAEDRYDELANRVRRALRYWGVNDDMFNTAMRDMDHIIQTHIIEEQEL